MIIYFCTVVVLIYLSRIYLCLPRAHGGHFLSCALITLFVWLILLYTGGDTVGGNRCEAKNSWLGIT